MVTIKRFILDTLSAPRKFSQLKQILRKIEEMRVEYISKYFAMALKKPVYEPTSAKYQRFSNLRLLRDLLQHYLDVSIHNYNNILHQRMVRIKMV